MVTTFWTILVVHPKNTNRNAPVALNGRDSAVCTPPHLLFACVCLALVDGNQRINSTNPHYYCEFNLLSMKYSPGNLAILVYSCSHFLSTHTHTRALYLAHKGVLLRNCQRRKNTKQKTCRHEFDIFRQHDWAEYISKADWKWKLGMVRLIKTKHTNTI